MIHAPSDSIILTLLTVAHYQPLPINLSTEGCKSLCKPKKRHCSAHWQHRFKALQFIDFDQPLIELGFRKRL